LKLEGGKMRKNPVILNKTLVIGILVLFVVICIQPAFAVDLTTNKGEQQLENELSITTNPLITRGGTFNKTIGGKGGDKGRCVQQTTDGGYIITGHTSTYSTSYCDDVWLVKTDNAGNEVWNKTFGGADYDFGYYVQQTTDGGYIITGYTWDGWEGLLIKTDSSGNKEWDTTLDDGVAYNVQQTTDGSYILTGTIWGSGAGENDVWLSKFDSIGNMEWNRTFGGADHDYGRYGQLTSDGGYIITGSTVSFGNGNYGDVWLIKTDNDGNEVWNKTYGGIMCDTGMCVQLTSDGGYIITGYTSSSTDYNYNVYLLKTDSVGNKEWEKTFGGPGHEDGNYVQQTTDGGYIIIGDTSSSGNQEWNWGLWLIKTNSDGNMVWDKIFGGKESDFGRCVQQTTDEGYIITGYTDSFGAGGGDVWLIKTDKDGNVRNKALTNNHSLLLRLLERFPLLQKLLQQLQVGL
jgi:hypothetical protein